MASPSSAVLLILVFAACFAAGSPFVPRPGFSANLPIARRARAGLAKRGSQSGATGLGDSTDIAYSVQVTVGSVSVPVLIDTGSSDLWSITSDCSARTCGDSSSSTPKISASALKSSGIPVELDYGDSTHGTFAAGMIASGNVGLAGLQQNDQFLAAVNTTNAGLSDENISGIFGIGFPNPRSGSTIFEKLIDQKAGAQAAGAALTDAFLSALPTQGPFLSRLVNSGELKQPMFTMTLQREVIEVGGNVGQLTIGQLPDGVSNDSLTWVPVRLYTEAQGGVAGPTSNPSEMYPARWEIPIDDVLLNGQRLPKPSLPTGIGYTALIDSGTSFLAGPSGVVSTIYSTTIDPAAPAPALGARPFFPCARPVNVAYVIGGKTFPVDPRDFLGRQARTDHCTHHLAPTDAPAPGGLMSWVLGDPFMKSALVAFYFGNLTHPSVDPPRMGFLSTVPSNVNDLFAADVRAAQAAGKFVAASVTAPAGPPAQASAAPNGVGQAAPTTATTPSSNDKKKNAAGLLRAPVAGVVLLASLCSFL